MRSIIITGVSGYLGTLLARRLDREPEVERIIGLDVKEPSFVSPKFTFVRHDIRLPFADILSANEIDTAVHLAFVVIPTHDEDRNREINIQGSQNFLESCRTAGVKQVYYMGSHTEYGAYADSPGLFTEDRPLHPNNDYPYPVEKTEVDLMFQHFSGENPGICVTIGRTVAVTGPCGDACGLTALFLPMMVKMNGKDPLWQFIHEEDWAELVVRLIRGKKGGVFNLTAGGGLTYSQMIKKLGKPALSLPPRLLYGAVKLTWRLRLQARSQAGALHLLEYPINIDNAKVIQATGYAPRFTGEQAFDAFLQCRQSTEKH
jgi:UDP-glucose 4-epimerase